jgi:hypothetical protein
MEQYKPMRKIMLALVVISIPALAHAQVPVVDAPTETATAKTAAAMTQANQTLDQIQHQATMTAQSLTVGYGGSRYASQLDLLNSLMQTATSGVADADSFKALFTGWKDLGENRAQVGAQQTAVGLKTFASAISVAFNQANHFAAEERQFQKLSACISAQGITAVQAQQCDGDIGLFVAQQIQLERQLQITQIVMNAVSDGWMLSSIAQVGASNEVTQTTAGQQQ